MEGYQENKLGVNVIKVLHVCVWSSQKGKTIK